MHWVIATKAAETAAAHSGQLSRLKERKRERERERLNESERAIV